MMGCTRLDVASAQYPRTVIAFGVMMIAIAGAQRVCGDEPRAVADKLLREAHVEGGLVVHVGCTDGQLTAALRASKRLVVHGLTTDPTTLLKSREPLIAARQYGPVSTSTFDGVHLPYADGLVNMIVAEQPYRVAADEWQRALAPGGALWRKVDGRWLVTHKPWPSAIDQWTHHLHDATGNAVAKDRVVGPPARLQWTAGPLWARSHGYTPSVSTMVSATGRLFYISDQSLTGIDSSVPSRWFLVARDAFSGVELWRRRVPNWGAPAMSGTLDTGRPTTVGRFTMPTDVNKRLVAVGDSVFVTLGAAAPVTVLDAATGETRRVLTQSANADELLVASGRLIMSINVAKGTADKAPTKRILAVDPVSGKTLWQSGLLTAIRASVGQDPYGRLELCAGDDRVFALTTTDIVCLDQETGQLVWQKPRPALPPDAVTRVGYAGMYEYKLTVMVYHDGVLLLAQPEPNTHHTYHTMPGSLYAFAAPDGKLLWKRGYGAWGHCTPPDVFVMDDTVWTHVYADTEFGFIWGKGFKAKDSSVVDYRIQALDLRTGQLKKELSTKLIFNVGHHHRCYRNKSTERFLMSCRRGVEFVDLETGENYQNHWVRSGCLLGYLPCNGMLYVTPHPCQCYINAKLVGFNALRAAASPVVSTSSSKSRARLRKGPAYGTTLTPLTAAERAAQWPAFRHDAQRSGATATPVAKQLSLSWRTRLPSATTAITAAAGKVFVAARDAHTLYALDRDNGTEVWHYTTDGRIDAPPTYYRGLLLFGTAVGRAFALRAHDGALAWTFDAAPRRELIMAFDQLESPWPIPGVLVQDDECCFAAGRSSYVDGGVHCFALEPVTGDVIRQRTVYSPDPKTGKMTPDPDGFQVPGLLNDVPSSDGQHVFIRQEPMFAEATGSASHLYSTAGFLDSSWFNRTFWQIGRARSTGQMVLGDGVAYATEVYPERSRESVFKPAANAYRLRCLSLGPPPRGAKKSANKAQNAKQAKQTQARPVWQVYLAMRPAAMVRAGDVIWIAGTPDVVEPDDPNAAWQGRDGGVLAAYSTVDGHQLARTKLVAAPVWQGMAVAGNRLLVALADGSVECFQ